MKRDWVSFLVDEVQDLLGAGNVGLYEFFEILRSEDAAPPQDEWTDLSLAALGRLQREPDIRLVRTVWARSDLSEPADGATPTAADWQTPTEKPYLALDTV